MAEKVSLLEAVLNGSGYKFRVRAYGAWLGKVFDQPLVPERKRDRRG